MPYIIKHLKQIRAAQFLSQEELAVKAVLSCPTIRQAEIGGEVSLGTLRKLAAALDMEPAELIHNKGVRK